jgi:Pumilio-family RNA binding repeat
MSPVVQ